MPARAGLLAIVAAAILAALATRAGGNGVLPSSAAAVLAGALGLNSRAPRAAAGAAGAALVLLLVTAPSPTVPVLLAGVNGFCVARWVGGWAAAAFAVLAVAAVEVGVTDDALIPNLLFVTILIAAGHAIRSRDELARQLAKRGAELEAERDVFAELSVRYERSRIAAELHDIVAHAISVMVVQASAGQRLAAVDPAATEDSFRAIGEAARHAKADVARLVELLADDAVEAGEADLSIVRELVARAAQTGLDVTLRVEGDRTRMAGPPARSTYLVVREGLTNTLRYASGAPVRVRVEAGEDELHVEIVNDAAAGVPALEGHGTGNGLRGLREQLDTCGGWLEAGPTTSGGWRLAAGMPLSALQGSSAARAAR